MTIQNKLNKISRGMNIRKAVFIKQYLCPVFFSFYFIYFYLFVGSLHYKSFQLIYLYQVELSALLHIQEENFLLTQNISKCHTYCPFLAYLCDTVRMIFLLKFTVYYAQKKIGWIKYFPCPVPLNILKQMASLVLKIVENMSTSFTKSSGR